MLHVRANASAFNPVVGFHGGPRISVFINWSIPAADRCLVFWSWSVLKRFRVLFSPTPFPSSFLLPPPFFLSHSLSLAHTVGSPSPLSPPALSLSFGCLSFTLLASVFFLSLHSCVCLSLLLLYQDRCCSVCSFLLLHSVLQENFYISISVLFLTCGAIKQ